MKLLLDTHVAMWMIGGFDFIDKDVKELIMDNKNDIYYSTVTTWEIEIKHLKKPNKMMISGNNFANLCEQAGFININIKNEHINELKNIIPVDESDI